MRYVLGAHRPLCAPSPSAPPSSSALPLWPSAIVSARTNSGGGGRSGVEAASAERLCVPVSWLVVSPTRPVYARAGQGGNRRNGVGQPEPTASTEQSHPPSACHTKLLSVTGGSGGGCPPARAGLGHLQRLLPLLILRHGHGRHRPSDTSAIHNFRVPVRSVTYPRGGGLLAVLWPQGWVYWPNNGHCSACHTK